MALLRSSLLVACSLIFVIAGLLVAVREGHVRAGLLAAVFFASVATIELTRIAALRRMRRSLAVDHAEQDLVWFVGREVHLDRRRLLRRLGVTCVFLLVIAGLAGVLSAWIVALALVLAALILGVLALVWRGRIALGSLRFGPHALWVSTGRVRWPVDWDGVVAAELRELRGAPALCLRVRDGETMVAAAQGSGGLGHAAARGRAWRRLHWNRRRHGHDVVIWTNELAVDPALLLRAVRRCVADPTTRR